ncbi:unnamed protein product [Schistocephalus solidus]|uniref:Amidase domain-containing protein n=1 Tax=Schistocephalus solidus TaxID=70667 RepID=A0A183THW0_SCHSO|nr:unnamed protein product [Schistocephalus solidus]
MTSQMFRLSQFDEVSKFLGTLAASDNLVVNAPVAVSNRYPALTCGYSKLVPPSGYTPGNRHDLRAKLGEGLRCGVCLRGVGVLGRGSTTQIAFGRSICLVQVVNAPVAASNLYSTLTCGSSKLGSSQWPHTWQPSRPAG